MKVLELLAIQAGDPGLVGRAGEEISPLIHDRHLSRRELGNRRGHQVDDPGDLPRIEHPSRTELHEDRGAGLLGLADEHRRPGNRQVDASLLDLGHRLDRAGQVSFEGALVVDLLDELAHAEFLRFHQLEADATALRQALGRQLQPDLVDHFGRDEDRTAPLRDAVGHVHLGQLGDDGTAVFLGDVGEQDLVFLPTGGDDEHQHQGDDTGDTGDEADLPAVAELIEAPREGEQGFAGSLCHERNEPSAQTCMLMISWYAETRRLRTCTMVWKDRLAFWSWTMTSCRFTFGSLASKACCICVPSCWTAFT